MGGMFGFGSMYLLFFWVIEKYCLHLRALSEGKCADYIRREYIKEFPNTWKGKMYAEFDLKLREKYDITKY